MMVYLILLLGLLLRVISFDRGFWFNETLALLHTQSAPSFQHFFLHYWLKLGVFDEWFLRLPSLIFAFLSLLLIYHLTHLLAPKTYLRLNQHKISLSLLSLLILAINPLHIYYSQSLESYSFYFFLGLAFLYASLRILKIKTSSTFQKLHPHHLAHFVLVFVLLSSYLIFLFPPKIVNEDWQSAFNHISSQISDPSQSQVIFAYGGVFPPAEWYQPNLNYLSPLNDLDPNDPSALDLDLNSGTLGKSDIYYFRYLELITDPSRNITTWLSNAGYTLIDTITFPGVGAVDHYRAHQSL